MSINKIPTIRFKLNVVLKILATGLILGVNSSAAQANSCLGDDSINAELDKQQPLISANKVEDVFNVRICIKVDMGLTEAPNIVSVYSAKDIEHLGARTLSDVLKIIAGVQIQQKGNNRENLTLRGVPSEFNHKVSLFIDNVPYKTVFGGFPIDEEIALEMVKSIEIIRGPGSTSYGANAFSGVINLYTFQPNERKQNVIKAGVGERDTAFSFFSLEHDFKDYAQVMLEGKWLTTDGRKPDYNNNGKSNHRTGDQDLAFLRFKAKALDNRLSFSGSYNQFDNSKIDNPIKTNPRKHENYRFSLAFQEQLTPEWAFSSLGYYTHTVRSEWEDGINLKGKPFSAEFLDETSQLGVNLLSSYQLSPENKLTAGFEYKREELITSKIIDNIDSTESSFIIDPRYDNMTLNTYSFFIQDQHSFFDKRLNLHAGLRFDKLDLFADQLSYRLGLTYSFTEQYYLKLLYGTAYRAPSFIEFVRVRKENQPLPKIETIDTVELQLGYQSKLDNEGKALQSNLTFYHTRYNDLIFRESSLETTIKNPVGEKFINVGDLNIIGIELESKLIFDSNWSGFLNLAWTNARSERQQQLMPMQTTKTLAAGIEYKQDLWAGELLFHNHFIVYDMRKDWDAKQQRHSNRSEELNDGFMLWNTGLHYTLDLSENKKQQLKFSLTVHNLLDEDYYTQALTPPKLDKEATFDTQYQKRHTRFTISYLW